ncbi:EsaB/YukD family protein [Thermoclostridium caenicola]|uniref:WXG100 protein secretion system (Wss), protein YukD n=1 Tax=Thermoclostridium caenicola TaxID=659425 RepID=A0A1M6ISA0_9FIRM|nr:EsaB/YukD family protein [Thermoclostridium caenicola]SHJ37350.1 WXG100 protein secretion system (Wss), protein YukD [Thermoclostridium caenicola]
MSQNSAIITVNLHKRGISRDLEVPLDISANELCSALNHIFFPEQPNDMNQFYLKAERPIALLRGDRTLREYGIRDGSVINITR